MTELGGAKTVHSCRNAVPVASLVVVVVVSWMLVLLSSTSSWRTASRGQLSETGQMVQKLGSVAVTPVGSQSLVRVVAGWIVVFSTPLSGQLFALAEGTTYLNIHACEGLPW